MKFQVQKSTFQRALLTAICAVPNKSTLQILNNFALYLEGNTLEINSTDFDWGIREKIDVQGEGDGSVVLNAHKLFELIKSLVDPKIETISFEVVDYLATIRWSERGKASITGFDTSDFPPFPDISEGDSLQLAKSELEFLVGKTLFAVSNDITRKNLNGVYLEAKNGKLLMVATDGHRLGQAFIEHENIALTKNVILPSKVIQNVLKNFDSDATIEMHISDTHVLFATEGLQISSKLVEGPYPKYEAVIPQKFERSIQVNREDFLNKISSVLPMANVRTRQIRLQIDGNQMELSANDPNVGGDSTEAISIIHEGEGVFSIGFNGQYLAEIIKLTQSDDIILKMNNPTGACIIEPVGSGLDFIFLLMPLRLIEE